MSFEALNDPPSTNVLLADQAGCGKTLAYLAPIVQQLRNEEKKAGQRVTESKHPRALVIVPTAGRMIVRGHTHTMQLVIVTVRAFAFRPWGAFGQGFL